MGSANKRQRYSLTSYPIGWAHTQNDLWAWKEKSRCYLWRNKTVFEFLACDCRSRELTAMSWDGSMGTWWVNIVRPLQYSRYVADDIFKCISLLYFDPNFAEVCSSGSHCQYVSSGSGNRRQTIAWNDIDPDLWRYVVSTRPHGVNNSYVYSHTKMI